VGLGASAGRGVALEEGFVTEQGRTQPYLTSGGVVLGG